jgi:KDO2-lipid IV(A) lauroyltransferase
VNLAAAALGRAAALAARLPYGWFGALGALLGRFVGDVLRVRRAEVERRLRLAGVPAPAATARGMYVSLGRGLLELLWAGGRPGRALGAHVEPTERARAVLAAVRGRGAVIASAHTGNWDLAACALAERHSLLVVTKRLRARALDALWQGLRRGRGVSLTSGRGAVAACLRALGEGRLVAVMIDQAPEGPGRALAHPFLGRAARHDRLAAALAARAGRPLVVAFPRRAADGTHVLDVADVLEPPAGGAGPAWVDEATRRASAALETFVRAHPDQWLWLHRRWKGAADGPPGAPVGPGRGRPGRRVRAAAGDGGRAATGPSGRARARAPGRATETTGTAVAPTRAPAGRATAGAAGAMVAPPPPAGRTTGAAPNGPGAPNAAA